MSERHAQHARDLRPARRVRRSGGAGRRRRARRTTPAIAQMDAYTPYPIEEVSEALRHHHSRLPLIVLGGGVIGCLGGFGLAVLGLGRSPTR